MKQKFNLNCKQILLFISFALLKTISLEAQREDPIPISLSWDTEVGCQNFYNVRDEKNEVFFSDITPSVCIKVCEGSRVTYTINGSIGAEPQTLWTVTGGTIVQSSDTVCTVDWGTSGAGNLSFTLFHQNNGTSLTQSICIDKIIIPYANFTATATVNFVQIFEPEDGGKTKPFYYVSCTDQNIYFNNLSVTNNGTSIVSYLWDFGDGTTSTETAPVHVYHEDGGYKVTLTATNSCGCTSTKTIEFIIKGKGFDILCPTVVCENTITKYHLPFEAHEICESEIRNSWTIVGGHILDTTDSGEVTVKWDNIGASGFGFLTFNPHNCSLPCLTPTTIKVPVVKSVGTIVGKNTLCLNEQSIYKLPQWPTTQVTWSVLGDATLILTDQWNEVVVQPIHTGDIILRATYQNTLLHCGGTAEFHITVGEPYPIIGNTLVCVNSGQTYTTTTGDTVHWTITNPDGFIVNESNNEAIDTHFEQVGNYIVTITGEGVCGNNTISVTSIALPEAPSIASNPTIDTTHFCPNVPYVYYIDSPDSNYNYRWEVVPAAGASIIGSPTGTQVTVSFDGNNSSYQLLAYKESKAPAICSSSPAVLQVQLKTINATLAYANTSSQTLCSNKNGQYQVVDTANSNNLFTDADTIVWSIVNTNHGSITSGQGTNQINVLWNNTATTINATLQCVITKCTLQKVTLTLPVTIVPRPEIKISPANATICSGSAITLTVSSNTPNLALSIPSNPYSQISWNSTGTPTTPTDVTSQANLSNTLTLTNISDNQINKTIIVTLTNPGGCGGIATASTQVIVKPGPTAGASLAFGGNVFCKKSQINCIISSSTSTGATIQWYRNDISSPVGTFNVNSYYPQGFGNYFFIATNPNGCTTTSNVISIIQKCPNDQCSGNAPSVTNLSGTACAVDNVTGTNITTIVLQGSVTPNINGSYWNIMGPQSFPLVTEGTAAVPITAAGLYNVFHVAPFLCDGELTNQSELRKVVVPYIPEFNYTATCVGNSNFTIAVSDNSDFYTEVPQTSRTFQYSYKEATSSTWINSISTASGTLVTNLPSGNYQIKLQIGGTYQGTPQPLCEVILPFSVQTMPPVQIVQSNNIIKCYDSPVGFKINPPLQNLTYLWTFESGVENTLPQPQRVFSSSGPQTVSVKVTNASGCIYNPTPLQVTIPPKCFDGTISSDATTACANTPITLNYTSSVQNCSPSFIWMNDSQAIATTSDPFIEVNQTGSYWVKIVSGDGCEWDSDQRLPVSFRNPPSLSLQSAGTYCEGDTVVVTAQTATNEIVWIVDGHVVDTGLDPYTCTITNLPVGDHHIKVFVGDGYCSNASNTVIHIIPKPQEPIAGYTILKCDPYQVELFADAGVDGVGNYTWSNGGNGQVTNVYDGGPYLVRFSLDGCSVTKEVDVPKNPQDYMWIFPSGCMDQCRIQETNGVIIGPRLPLPYWAWIKNDTTADSGQNSFPTPYQVMESGTYQLGINTISNNTDENCYKLSNPLHYNTNGCEYCPIEFYVKEVYRNIGKYCSYTVVVSITNTSSNPISLSLTDPHNQILSPTTVIVPGGTTNTPFSFVVIPLNNVSGDFILLLTGQFPLGQSCFNHLSIDIPSCDNQGGAQVAGKSISNTVVLPKTLLLLDPNPTQEKVNIHFEASTETATIAIYDLTGRLMNSYQPNSYLGDWNVDTSQWSTGIYLVVLKEENNVLQQQKLIKQ